MRGRFQDTWRFMWEEIWLPLENVEYLPHDIYSALYVELAKAYRKAPNPVDYDSFANDEVLARTALQCSSAADLRGENSIARFLEDAYDVFAETGHPELPSLYRDRVRTFLESRNMWYELAEPFQIKPHLSGVFSALITDILAGMQAQPELNQAVREFDHSFGALSRSHSEPDMKTCIQKSAMLVEALASVHPNAQGSTLNELCESIDCWPHSCLKEAMKKLYGFCSDYPGIRHNISRRGALRPLEMRDSVIVPLLLLTASGYFASNDELLATLRSDKSDVDQLPSDPPLIDIANQNQNLP